jgi:hypothetical protein
MSNPRDTDGSGTSDSLSKESIQEYIREIKEHLIDRPELAVSQLGKFNIQIDKGSEIHIGDTINQSWDQDSINALVLAIKEANESTKGKVYEYLQILPLEPLKVNIETVKRVNSDLEIVSNLESQGYLTETQKSAFLKIKREIHSLNDFDRRLEELHQAAKKLLQDTQVNLQGTILSLKKAAEDLLDPKAIEELAKEQDCKEKELRILEGFIEELEDAEKIADWINAKRKTLAKRFGREALKEFPEIEQAADPDKVSEFCFSIYQFLEQIAHSLKWGRRNILDDPEIPLVLDYAVYEKALSLIKEVIREQLPTRFNQKSRELACECIDYLTSQLPLLEVE